MNRDKHEIALTYLNTYNIPYLIRVGDQSNIAKNKIKLCITDILIVAEFPDFDDMLLLNYYEKLYSELPQDILKEQAEYDKFSSWYFNYINELQELIEDKYNISFLKEDRYLVTALDIYLYKII